MQTLRSIAAVIVWKLNHVSCACRLKGKLSDLQKSLCSKHPYFFLEILYFAIQNYIGPYSHLNRRTIKCECIHQPLYQRLKIQCNITRDETCLEHKQTRGTHTVKIKNLENFIFLFFSERIESKKTSQGEKRQDFTEIPYTHFTLIFILNYIWRREGANQGLGSAKILLRPWGLPSKSVKRPRLVVILGTLHCLERRSAQQALEISLNSSPNTFLYFFSLTSNASLSFILHLCHM